MAVYRPSNRADTPSQGGNGRIRMAFSAAVLGGLLHLSWPDAAPEQPEAGANDNTRTTYALSEKETITPRPKPENILKASFQPSVQTMPPASSSPRYVYKTNGKKEYPIDEATYAAIQKVSQKTGIPAEAQMAVCARESSCRPKQINPSSGACGIMQFMTNHVETLYEVTYRYAEQAGYPQARKLVERYEKSRDKDGNPYLGYRAINAEAKQKLVNLCLDPEFNLTMWAAYTRPKIDQHEKWLGSGRKLTPGELVAMNNIGQRGLQMFFEQVMKDKKGKDTLAVDFFKRHAGVFGNISANKSLLQNENGKPLTVRQSYNRLINEHGGWGELKLASAAP